MKRLRELLKHDMEKNPDVLLRLYIITTIVSIIAILFLVGTGFHRILQRYVLSSAEREAINVSRVLLAEEADTIITTRGDGHSYLEVRRDDIPRLDRHLRRFLAPLGIVKIKIYTTDSRVVYSTDPTIIGKLDTRNMKLKHAFAGRNDSHLERKDDILDLAGEQKFNIDVVETYIPISGKNTKVIGSFEIYLDVTEYRDQIQLAVVLSVCVLAFALFLVFGPSFLLIRKESRAIKAMQEIFKTQAITDPLTGLCNKRQITLLIQKGFSRVERGRTRDPADCQFGCIMIDIDKFKQINDTYGHLAGDVLLRDLADRISPSLRVYDTVGRFGGDEFVVILPGSDMDHSCDVAQRIWSLVRDEPFQLDGVAVRVTLSLGVSTSEVGDADYTCMLKRAADALYKAKNEGRDRYESVYSAPYELPPPPQKA